MEHIEATAAHPADRTVEWWELRNAKDQAVYREAYPLAFENGQFAETVVVSASSFTTKQGSGILVRGMDLPSTPESGGWLRVFGYKYGRDKYGADETLFVPFGPPISIEGECLDVDTDSFRPSPVFAGRAMATVTRDELKFRVWTGNVNHAISFAASGDLWLKVRIDGQEGWIHSEEDFEAVGLPQAG